LQRRWSFFCAASPGGYFRLSSCGRSRGSALRRWLWAAPERLFIFLAPYQSHPEPGFTHEGGFWAPRLFARCTSRPIDVFFSHFPPGTLFWAFLKRRQLICIWAGCPRLDLRFPHIACQILMLKILMAGVLRCFVLLLRLAGRSDPPADMADARQRDFPLRIFLFFFFFTYPLPFLFTAQD